MALIAGKLSNADFTKAVEIANEQGVELKEWVASTVIAEIRRLKPDGVKQA